jgi:proteasome-associated ATPase
MAMTQSERELLADLKEKLQEQDELIKQLIKAPQKYAMVMRADRTRVTMAMGNELLETDMPTNMAGKLIAGVTVKLNAETGGITDILANPITTGMTATIKRLVESSDLAEVETEGGKRIVCIPAQMKGKLKADDQVICDPHMLMILRNLGKKTEAFTVTDEVYVAWNDIGGLENAKQQLKEAIELPVSHPRIFEKYGHKPPKGIMLYGPPGCGKTLLAKAAVTALARLHGKKSTGTGFIYIKGPEILSKWVGESEATIRGIFGRAREHHQMNGFPAVVFLDEADAILGRRGSGRSSDMERTIVPQFLAEMDGLSTVGAPLVLIATNRPDTLDPAVVRDGRIDRKIMIERPKQKDVTEIFRINLRKKPVAEANMAEHGTAELFDANRMLFKAYTQDGQQHCMTLGHTVNGAMVAGIVARSVSLAMHREIAGGKSGVSKDDITRATTESMLQLRDVDMQDEVQDFVSNLKDVVRVVRA